MTAAQPAFELPRAPETPFGAVVARQVSVWPFASRTARLFLLVDPNLPDESIRAGLLRAMQQAYFASDGYSQTRAIREAALAAHYVLRHYNRDALPLAQVNAATAVAAVRAGVAFVALAGHAAALAWRDGELTGQHGVLRLPRPLGLEHDPSITLWSTPLEKTDRLVLVCGATWHKSSPRVIREVLALEPSNSEAEEQLAQVLGNGRPAGVLVVGPGSGARPERHLKLVAPNEPRTPRPDTPRKHRPAHVLRRLLTSVFGAALLATVVLAALTIVPDPVRHADESASAATVAAERIDRVSPAMAVRLGPAAANVVDVAVGEDALYTLDVSEGSVRVFATDALDQQPNPGSVLARAGAPLDTTGRRLATPVAVQYVADGLVIVDQARAVVEVGHDRTLRLRSVPTSAAWQAVGALGADGDGHLLFLDSGSRRLLQYPPLTQRVVDPPQLVLDASTAPGVVFEHAADVLFEDGSTVLRLDDGSVHRYDANGGEQSLPRHPADGKPIAIRSMAADRGGGVFLLDTAHARLLQVMLDGTVLRELRDPLLGGVRQIRTDPQGRRVFGLVASGVLVFDIPAM